MIPGFADAFAVVIGHEGGYVNDPRDPGGETKYGISKRSYPALNIADLTLEDARFIYKRDYWDKCRCDELPWVLALNLFDSAVNHGVKPAIKMMQSALNVDPDGILGPITLRAAWEVNRVMAAVRFNAARLEFYTTLPTFATFGRGWARRVAANLRSIA